jgi:hypothetical protein
MRRWRTYVPRHLAKQAVYYPGDEDVTMLRPNIAWLSP